MNQLLKDLVVKIVDVFFTAQTKEPGVSWGITRSSAGKWELWCEASGGERLQVEHEHLGLACIKLGQDMRERGLVKFNDDPAAN